MQWKENLGRWMTNTSHENMMMEEHMEYDETTGREVQSKDCK